MALSTVDGAASARSIDRQQRLRNERRCRICGKKDRRTRAYTLCARCREKNLAYGRARRARLLAASRCTVCTAPSGRHKMCADCRATYCTRNKAYHRSQRDEAIHYYGGKCVCCGEHERNFLQFDHIHGRGNRHRKQTTAASTNIAGWLKRHHWPRTFRLLCANCNYARRFGPCPHEGNPRCSSAPGRQGATK